MRSNSMPGHRTKNFNRDIIMLCYKDLVGIELGLRGIDFGVIDSVSAHNCS